VPQLITAFEIGRERHHLAGPGSSGTPFICAKPLRFFSLSGRSKIDFGHFDPMFRSKLIWVELDSHRSAAGQRFFTRP
jgi:hypothetical protein